jgi:hypothetical protein
MTKKEMILKRIEALEAEKAARKAEAKAALPPPLAMFIIARFGGRYDEKASPFENYFRALGLDKAVEFHALLPEQRQELHRDAMNRIFRKRGVRLDSDATTPAEVDAVLLRLAEQLHKAKIVPDASWLGGFTTWPKVPSAA